MLSQILPQFYQNALANTTKGQYAIYQKQIRLIARADNDKDSLDETNYWIFAYFANSGNWRLGCCFSSCANGNLQTNHRTTSQQGFGS